ncbi:MAG: ATP-binding protein [Alphaproteobacteria bacterium]
MSGQQKKGTMVPSDFQTLFYASPSLYLILNPHFIIVDANEAYLRATKTQRCDIVGHSIFDAFPDNPGDKQADGVRNLRASLERALKTKQSDTMAVQKYDIRRPEHEGGGFEERYWSPVNSPVMDEMGRVIYLIHRVMDVTDFVRLKKDKTATTNHKKPIDDTDAEVYVRAQEIQEANRKIEAERLQLEQELWQAQKMESLGQLTGGIAHDFNNLLGLIMGSLDMMEGKVSGAAEESRTIALNAVMRGAELIKSLLAFSRQQPLNPTIIDVNEHVTKMAKLLQRVLGEPIETIMDLADNLTPVRIDPVQLESVITNLAINARDAMPKGGRLILSTSNVTLDADYCAQNPGVATGDYVCIDVADNGTGISPEIMARVFEPFFTTKEIGKGTGLGLAMVYGFVKQSQGHIKIYSEVGRGTSIKIYLPHHHGIVQKTETKTNTTSHAGKGETILVIEDNNDLRAMTIKQLHDLGYQTVEMINGDKALAYIKAGKPYDFLLSDVVMPGQLSGFDVACQSLVFHPKAPVLLISGFPGIAVEEQQKMATNKKLELLSKPYRKTDLARKIRELMDKDK